MITKNMEPLRKERTDLGKFILADTSFELGQKFRDRQAELFDLAFQKRDPDGYASLEAECADLRAQHIAACDAVKAECKRSSEIVDLLGEGKIELDVDHFGDAASRLAASALRTGDLSR